MIGLGSDKNINIIDNMQVSKISLVFVLGNCTVERDIDSGHLMLPVNIHMVRNATLYQLVCTVFFQVFVNAYTDMQMAKI